jgi:hypothetical protein
VGDDDLDFLHAGHYRGMITDAATGLPRARTLGAAGGQPPAESRPPARLMVRTGPATTRCRTR